MVIAVTLGLSSVGLASCGGEEGSRGGSETAGTAGSGAGDVGDDDETGSSTGGSTPTGTGSSTGGSGATPAITSVPGNSVLSELAPAQATQVCEETTDAMDPTDESRQRLLCTVPGLLDGATAEDPVATCEASVSRCMAAASTAATANDCSLAADALAECDATVDEVNACIAALSAMEKQYGSTLNCETTDATILLGLATSQAASCLSLDESCTGFSAP